MAVRGKSESRDMKMGKLSVTQQMKTDVSDRERDVRGWCKGGSVSVNLSR